MRYAFSFLIFILSTVLFSQKLDKRLRGFDQEIEDLMKKQQTVGCAVAIVIKGEVVFSKGFGYRDLENKLKVNDSTLFPIGSCTKAFTTGLLGSLREEGKFSFEDKPSKYLPNMLFHDPEMNASITIRDMILHRTGLPRHDGSWIYFPSKSKTELLARVQYLEPFTTVRNKWYYNNFMYLAQGMIAEKITSKSWEENIQERFFSPLHMRRSTCWGNEFLEDKNHALGYGINTRDSLVSLDFRDITGMAPAGAINSNVVEMCAWLKMWMNGGRYKSINILPQNYVEEAIQSHAVVDGSLPDELLPRWNMSNYGYAWFNSSFNGHYIVDHGGAVDGFSAEVSFAPKDSIGIVVLTNQNESIVPTLIMGGFYNRMFGGEKKDWNELGNKLLEKYSYTPIKKIQLEILNLLGP